MILIALGSNLGDRARNLEAAIVALHEAGLLVSALSSVHETPALLPHGAPAAWNNDFFNQVIAVETDLKPQELLQALKIIERELGRTPAERWAPRKIDLDLLAYDDQIIVSEALTLPHPELDQRRFVLAPLVEIAPHWMHPVLGKSAAQLLKELA